MKNTETHRLISAQRFANLMLDMGTYLMASGAHCGRINTNLKRIADTWNFEMNLQLTFKGMLISAKSLDNPEDTITQYKASPPYYVHLEILTVISALSWQVVEKDLPIGEVEKEFSKIKNTTHYNQWIISIAIGIACGGLCIFSSGDIYNALVAFVAAFIGSLVRFQIMGFKFNPMISFTIAAFVTTLITGASSIMNIGENPQAAMATAVLYLIPGVPLINCVIDLIEGYLSSAMNRALFSGFILLCIAVGMTLSMTLLGIENFH